MSRNSEIDRAGMGQRVLNMSSAGTTAPAIAKAISDESGKQFSDQMIHRYIQKNSLNAAVSNENNSLEMLAAAISGLADARDEKNSSYFGKYKLNTKNTFTQYYGIARGIKNGQILRAFKNIALKVTNGATIAGDEKDTEKIVALMGAINFSALLQNVVRYTCEMGTCIVELKTAKGAYTTPSILPLQYYTLLTDRETPGIVADTLVHGEVTKIVFDEMGSNPAPIPREDVGLLRLWDSGNELKDIAGRNTFGIYGESMVIGVETPLKSLLNSSYYYDEFIARYGMGRLHINMKLLSEMIKEKTITPSAAQKTQDEDVAAIQKLGPNEDIITTGNDVSMLETRQGFDIVPYLDWRAKQIDRALLQSDVGAGDVGSSWTSAGIAVSAQDYDTYKSLRETLFAGFMEEIIKPRLPEFNLDPKLISITATPFLRVDVPYGDLIEMHDRNIISEPELRDRAGFPKVKPE